MKSCDRLVVGTQRFTPETQGKVPGPEKLLQGRARDSEDSTGERHARERSAPPQGKPERCRNPVKRPAPEFEICSVPGALHHRCEHLRTPAPEALGAQVTAVSQFGALPC